MMKRPRKLLITHNSNRGRKEGGKKRRKGGRGWREGRREKNALLNILYIEKPAPPADMTAKQKEN